MVADEVRRVLGDDDALAEMMIGEVGDRGDDGGIGLRRRNQLEQPQVARRVEEVRAQPVAAELVAAALRQRADRNARGVGADDRAGPARGLNPGEQRCLTSSRSTTASMIQSALASGTKPSSNPPS